MRFINDSPWIAVISIVNATDQSLVHGLGMIAAGKTLDAHVETFLRNPKRVREHKGLVRIVGEESKAMTGNDFLVTPGTSVLRPLNGAGTLALQLTAMEKPAVGMEFRIEVASEGEINVKRREARELFGRDIHIRAKIGPVSYEGSKIGCPIAAVDDPYLSGGFSAFPQRENHLLLIGYFKELS